MKGLSFRARYVPAILAGSKTTTLRRPRSGLPAAGERIRLICRYDRPPFAIAEVVEVRDMLRAELTEADAAADGFASLAELLEALADFEAGAPDAAPTLLPVPWRLIRFSLADTQ